MSWASATRTPTEYFHWKRTRDVEDDQEQADDDREDRVFAIWRPKLSETVCAPNDGRVDRAREVLLELVLLGDRQRLGADLEARVLGRPIDAPRPWMTASAWPISRASLAHLLERRRLRRAEA